MCSCSRNKREQTVVWRGEKKLVSKILQRAECFKNLKLNWCLLIDSLFFGSVREREKRKKKIYMRKKFKCFKFTKGFVDMLQPSTRCYNSLDIIIQREDLVLFQLILWFMVSYFLTWILIHILTYLLSCLSHSRIFHSPFFFVSTFSRINFGPTVLLLSEFFANLKCYRSNKQKN